MRRRLLLLLLGAGILAILWSRTGWEDLASLVETVRPGWLAAALMLLVLQVVLGAFRWRAAARWITPLPLPRASIQVLAVEALNVLLPSRAGDLAKGMFLARESCGVSPGVGVGMAVIEKWVDTTAFMLLVVVLGIASPPESRIGLLVMLAAAVGSGLSLALLFSSAAQRMTRLNGGTRGGRCGRVLRMIGDASELLVSFRAGRGRIPWLFALSGMMWALLLLQLSWVLRALGVEDPGTPLLWSRSTLALLVGMLPLTPAGIGTRDAAFLYFLGPWIGSAAALGLGVFTTLRYVILSLAGLTVLPWVGGPPVGKQVGRPSREAPDA